MCENEPEDILQVHQQPNESTGRHLRTADQRAISDEEKATALKDIFVPVFTNENTNPPACDMHPLDTPCPDLKLTHEQVHDELR